MNTDRGLLPVHYRHKCEVDGLYSRPQFVVGLQDFHVVLESYNLTNNCSMERANHWGQKKNHVFRATVLKALGRVGCCFFKNWNLNYKDHNEKKEGIFVKKSLGSAGFDR